MELEFFDERVFRKAKEIRAALAAAGIVHLGVPFTEFEDLPEDRKSKWIRLAEAYCEIF